MPIGNVLYLCAIAWVRNAVTLSPAKVAVVGSVSIASLG